MLPKHAAHPTSTTTNRRKPTKLLMEIIPSQNLSVYADGVYSLSGNMQRRGDIRRFYRRTLPRDLNCDSRIVTWYFHRRHHRWKESVSDSVGKNHYMPNRPTLSSSVSPSSSFPSHLSPPKLQLPSQTAAKHPSQLSTILNMSTQVSYILYVVTISVSYRFYYFFCK